MVLRVAASSNPQRLAKSIQYQLESEGKVTVQAVGKTAVGIAVIAFTINSDKYSIDNKQIALHTSTFSSDNDETKTGVQIEAILN